MMDRFVVAWTFLTIIPLRLRVHSTDDRVFARSLAAFPLVGLLLGAALAGASFAMDRLFPHTLVVVVIVFLLVWITGGLHLDGVADTADACGARSRDDALRIMKDSMIGAYGSLALITVLGLKIAGLSTLPAHELAPALVAMPVLGRWAQVQMTTGYPSARSEGAAKRFIAGTCRADYAAATAMALPVTALAMGLPGLLAAAVVCAFVAWFGGWVTRWLGGVTGDTIGAAGEGAEALAILTWAAVFHVRGAA
jgi:adenosylcobinamide-GDP ribazoletransferase